MNTEQQSISNGNGSTDGQLSWPDAVMHEQTCTRDNLGQYATIQPVLSNRNPW